VGIALYCITIRRSNQRSSAVVVGRKRNLQRVTLKPQSSNSGAQCATREPKPSENCDSEGYRTITTVLSDSSRDAVGEQPVGDREPGSDRGVCLGGGGEGERLDRGGREGEVVEKEREVEGLVADGEREVRVTENGVNVHLRR